MLIGDLDNVIKMNLQLLAGEGGEGNEEDPGDNGSDVVMSLTKVI